MGSVPKSLNSMFIFFCYDRILLPLHEDINHRTA